MAESKICVMTFSVTDEEYTVNLEIDFLDSNSGIEDRIKIYVDMLRYLIQKTFSDSNALIDRPPKSCEFNMMDDRFRVNMVLSKWRSWHTDSERFLHMDLARRISILDKTVITVYNNCEEEGLTKCFSCSFYKGGDQDDAKKVTCPSGSSVYGKLPLHKRCSNYQLSVKMLRFETVSGGERDG